MRTQVELAQKIRTALDNGEPINKFIYVELANVIAGAIRYDDCDLDPALLKLRDKVYRAFGEHEEQVRCLPNRFDWGACYYGFRLYDEHIRAAETHETEVDLNLKFNARDQLSSFVFSNREEIFELFNGLTNQKVCWSE